MQEVDYSEWSSYIIDISKEYVNWDAGVLELAAGTCKIANKISKFYHNLIVTDLSFSMLTRNKSNLNKVCCDMTRLPFDQKFDLIYSTFDSVNYLLNKRKLLNLFYEVKRILHANGIFTFDVSLEKNSLDFEKSFNSEGNYDGYSFYRKSRYNKKNRIHINIFKITDKNGNIITDVHKQKIFKFDTYFDLIDKAGMYVVECLETFTFNNGSENSERVQFIVKLNKKRC